MNKEILKQVILDQRSRYMPERYVVRARERDMKILKDIRDIVIVSGIRRCGKSTLLDAIRAKNKESDYYLNFDDERLIDFSVHNFQMLVEVFLELFGDQNIFYFDEIQNIPAWERFVRRLHDEGRKVYVTGSNAAMLSRELGTHLTGRYIEKQLYPFSFAEFLTFEGIAYDKKLFLDTRQKIKLKKAVIRYREHGGFPGYLQDHNRERLRTLYESIIYRDIIVRHNIPNEKPLKEMVHFCASNLGKEISFYSIANLIGLKNSTSVKEYFAYCEDSFLLFLVPRFAYSLKKQIYAPKKVYFIDTALAQNVGFRSSPDDGRFLENMTFIHLKRQNKEIYYHRVKKECDFLVKEGTRITEAIQVTADMSNEKTRAREIAGLLEAMKIHNLSEGIIITADESGDETIDGKKITMIPIHMWLLR